MTRSRSAAAVSIVGVLSAIAAVTLASACADEEIVLARLPPGFDAGGGVPALRCVDETGCSAQEFCARVQCFDVGGACETRPVVCSEDAMPVCGCDGITYWNDCLRKAAGITAMMPGECTMTAKRCGEGGGPKGGPPGAMDRCPPGAFCARLLPPAPEPAPPECPHEVFGSCWALPAVCPAHADPDRWIGCMPGSSDCVTTCDAIRTGEPHRRAKECF